MPDNTTGTEADKKPVEIPSPASEGKKWFDLLERLVDKLKGTEGVKYLLVLVIAGLVIIIWRVDGNGKKIEGKTDATTEQYINSLKETIADQRKTIADRDNIIAAKDAIMYGQDTTNRNLRMSLERANNLLFLKQNKQ